MNPTLAPPANQPLATQAPATPDLTAPDLKATVPAAPGITAPVPAAHRRRWYTLAVLCLSLLVIVVDSTIVNVALPTFARDLHASTSGLQWIVDAYTLAFAALLLLAGSSAPGSAWPCRPRRRPP